eukprot:5365441-Amphidinium_carterae.1
MEVYGPSQHFPAAGRGFFSSAPSVRPSLLPITVRETVILGCRSRMVVGRTGSARHVVGMVASTGLLALPPQ